MTASGTNDTPGQRAIDRFAEMIISRMEEMKSADWKKGWIGTSGVGYPQNVSGRSYSGSNTFFLQMYSAMKGFRIPAFMTFNQAKNMGAHVLKGEKSFPVVYWDVIAKDKDGNKVKTEDLRNMSAEEKKDLRIIPFIKAYPVYNVDQTNLKEVKPELYAGLENKFESHVLRDTQGMYLNKELDRMAQRNEWVCPIQADKPSDRAFYSPSMDIVVIPMKQQFNLGGSPEDIYSHGMEYYSTMLHEMTHSTLKPERLNRSAGGKFGDAAYAKEELVAELTAAMVSNSLGFDKRITDNSVAYLDNWIKALKQEPKFILSIMSDVNKASDMIMTHIDKQRLELGQEPMQVKTDPETEKREDISVVKSKKGDYFLRKNNIGSPSDSIKISKHQAYTYGELNNPSEANAFLGLLAREFDNKTTIQTKVGKTATMKV